MKEKIHPKYDFVEAVCACGNKFLTRSTAKTLKLDICAACHPFFTGKQKLLDTEGRVEKFIHFRQNRHPQTENRSKSQGKIGQQSCFEKSRFRQKSPQGCSSGQESGQNGSQSRKSREIATLFKKTDSRYRGSVFLLSLVCCF